MIDQVLHTIGECCAGDGAGVTFALVMMLFDIVSGFIQAVLNHEVSSAVMREGLKHKIGFLLALVLGALVEVGSQFINLGIDIPSLTAIALFISATEIISISENINKMNPELSAIFKILKERNNNEDE